MHVHFLHAAAVLQKISSQVAKKNTAKSFITDGEVEAFQACLQTVLNSFKSLADFKTQHAGTVLLLGQLPIDGNEVSTLQAQMP